MSVLHQNSNKINKEQYTSTDLNQSSVRIEISNSSSSKLSHLSNSSNDNQQTKETPIQTNENQKDNKLKGSLYFMISCLLFTMTILISKYISIKYPYISSFKQNAYRSIPALIISFFNMRNEEILQTLKKEYPKLFIRSITNFINNISLTLSSYFLKVTTSTTISSLIPIVTSLMAVYLLKERLTRTNIICLIISFIGCIILAKPFIDNGSNEEYGKSDSLAGYVFALVYLVSRSLSIILQKTISQKVDLQLVIFSINTMSICLSIIIELYFYNSNLLIGVEEFGVMVFSGVIMYYASLFTMMSIRETKIIFLQMLYPSIILFGFLVSVVFFGERPGVSDFIGAFIVLFINIYNSYDVYYEYKRGER